MSNHTLSQLDEKSVKAFQAIGIKSSADLAKVTPSQIWRDLEQLAEYFPQHKLELNEQTLIKLHNQACQEAAADELESEKRLREEQSQAIDNSPQVWTRGELRPEFDNDEDGDFPRKVPSFRPAYGSQLYLKERGLEPGQRQKRATHEPRKKRPTRGKQANKQTKGQAMRCRSSARTFIASILTLIMVPCIPLIMLAPLVMLIFKLNADYLYPFFIIYVTGFSLYFIYCFKIHCQVCHINLFTLREYPRNTYAHKYPLMTHSMSLALHILCCLWFRCPACGTAQQLFKPKRNSN